MPHRPRSCAFQPARLALVAALAASSAAASPPEPAPELRVPANPLLVRHSNFFTPTVYDMQTDPYSRPFVPAGLRYRVYQAVGYDLAASMLIVGPDGGLVVIDALGDAQSAREAVRLFRDKAGLPAGKLPLRAVIYTHNHIDHTGGVLGFLEEAQDPPCAAEDPAAAGPDGRFDVDAVYARDRCVTVIGQEQIVDAVTNTATVVGNIINPRSSFMYGAYIGENRINCGIGPQVNPGTPGFRLPSRTFSQSLDVLAAGVEMQLTYVPSETNDELAVFLPDARNGAAGEPAAAAGEGPGLLFSAEVIQGPSFPNLYSLRGTSYRNPATWFRSVDTLRRYDSWCMVPSHGPILCGRENVQRLLRSFRDAIQFTHDQAVRFINRGQTPPELALSVRLPGYLEDDVRRVRPARADMDPGDYLRTFYGSVPQAVREIYFGYLGWFEADPVGLSPVPQDLAAERLLSLAGGAAKLTGEAEAALKRGEAQWAAELATLVLRAPQAATLDDVKKRARETKAAAFVQLAEPELNPNWRNWYISAALQLRTNLPRRAITGGLVSPEIVGALPPAAWLNGWTLRLRAERTTTEEQTCGREFEGSPSGVCRTLGVWFSQAYPGAGPAGYALRIRRGVAAFQDGLTQAEVEQADLAIAVTQEAFEALVRADDSLTPGEFEQVLAKLFETGGVRILAGKGTAADVSAFFRDYFDPKMTTFPPLTVGS